MSHHHRRSNLAARRSVVGIIAALAVSHGVALANPPSRVVTAHPVQIAKVGSGHAIDPAPAAEPESYQADCNKPKDREEADLCEQRRMAKAAEDLVALTDRQVWLTKWEIAALVFTLLATAAAAGAAAWAVWVARETAKKELRAYLFCNPGDVELVDGVIAKVKLRIRNHGQTPANNVSLRGAVKVCPNPLPPNFDAGERGVGESTQSLGPHAELAAPLRATQLVPSDQEIDSLRVGTHRIYVFVVIRYDTAFMKGRTTKMCASLNLPNIVDFLEQTRGGESGSLLADWDFSTQHNEND